MKHAIAMIVAGTALAALAGCSAAHPPGPADPVGPAHPPGPADPVGPAHPAGSPPRSPSLSARPAAVARYVGFSVPGFPPNPDRLVALENATGVPATAVSFYMSLGQKLHITAVSSLRSSGILPVVEIDSDKIPFRDIAAGTQDGTLTSYARQIASVPGTVAIDFDHEFNARWMEWGYTHSSAATFIAAWRHVVTVFRRNGAANVAWVWNPYVKTGSTTAIRPWYPGDAWVTMVGLDGYFYTPKATFSTVFGPTLRKIRTFTRHPVLIVETGVNPSASRPAQISDLFQGARKAGIAGVIWFDYYKFTNHDWLIDHDPAALTAFRKAANTYR